MLHHCVISDAGECLEQYATEGDKQMSFRDKRMGEIRMCVIVGNGRKRATLMPSCGEISHFFNMFFDLFSQFLKIALCLWVFSGFTVVYTLQHLNQTREDVSDAIWGDESLQYSNNSSKILEYFKKRWWFTLMVYHILQPHKESLLVSTLTLWRSPSMSRNQNLRQAWTSCSSAYPR